MARTERWIKLRLHRRHPRIFDLADEMEVSADVALACCVDWFRQLDADGDPHRTYSSIAINGAAGSPAGTGFCEAARRIGWLIVDGDRFRPADPRQWFSEPAKKRLARAESGDDAPREPNGCQTDATGKPSGGRMDAQSRVESDEIRKKTDSEGDPNLSQTLETDTTEERGGQPQQIAEAVEAQKAMALKRREYVLVLDLVRKSGIAKNNQGRAVNWAISVIPNGLGFVKRVRQQALDQGLVEGLPDFAKYLYCALRDEAKLINENKGRPVDAPVPVESADVQQ